MTDLNENRVSLLDVNGDLVIVTVDTLFKALHKTEVFGMSLGQMGKLRTAYLRSGGRLPITDESIDEVYKT